MRRIMYHSPEKFIFLKDLYSEIGQKLLFYSKSYASFNKTQIGMCFHYQR